MCNLCIYCNNCMRVDPDEKKGEWPVIWEDEVDVATCECGVSLCETCFLTSLETYPENTKCKIEIKNSEFIPFEVTLKICHCCVDDEHQSMLKKLTLYTHLNHPSLTYF